MKKVLIKFLNIFSLVLLSSFFLCLTACDKQKKVDDNSTKEEIIIQDNKEEEKDKEENKLKPKLFTELMVDRKLKSPEMIDGIKMWDEFQFDIDRLKNVDLSNAKDLAYSLSVSKQNKFYKMPIGYDVNELIEWGKGPGLNVDILHKHGFTGKGATIAYIDQSINDHIEYKDKKNLHYIDNCDKKGTNSMHGPIVLSLLAGKNIGTAPDATVYYYAHDAYYADQLTHSECLYDIIEQNKKLPDDKKIKMVGFSDNIDDNEKHADEFREATRACEESGVMVFYCGDYRPCSFIPFSDKNNPTNVVSSWTIPNTIEVHVPTAGISIPLYKSSTEYVYESKGGLSWAMPYVLGLYASAIEINDNLTKEDLLNLLLATSSKVNGMAVINPVEFIAAVLDRANRKDEANILREEVKNREKYLYALIDYASINEDDFNAIKKYLSTINDYKVIVVNTSLVKDEVELYDKLKEDSSKRNGSCAGIQIFGDIDMIPSFTIKYRVQMQNEIDEGGKYYSDLFYSNFNNDSSVIGKNYSVYDHFNNKLDVDLVPHHKVVRLPLSKGEFAKYFDKYNEYINIYGTNNLDIVNFSNPIFASKNHCDDMGYFLNRMKRNFRSLDIPYELYGNLVGDYPVNTKVIGGFTSENLEKVNKNKPCEFIINSHGQRTNIDKCYFKNGEEIRESLINVETINQVLDDNYYFLDTWTCLNGHGMKDNLTIKALNGNCLGMFSATTIISNNGVDNETNIKELKNSNFYYFYYTYLKNINDGLTRSDAFLEAEKAYAEALLECSTRKIEYDSNYQFNLNNLLAYHNFGVIEPSKLCLTENNSCNLNYDPTTKVKKPVTVEKVENGFTKDIQKKIQFFNEKGDVIDNKSVTYSYENVKLENYQIFEYKGVYQDNGDLKLIIDCLMPKGSMFSCFNPPNGSIMMQISDECTGLREKIEFVVPKTDLDRISMITIKNFNFSNEQCMYMYFKF